MNRIRLLPEQLANQIAAGEVVERPASVVKELVENSLDAGATRIQVEVQAGGRSLIRVVDDGIGMSRDDALLSLERHATSKIRNPTDLGAINTLGFRGEAMPSIASVSRMRLTTRERNSESLPGTQIVISGGKIMTVSEGSGAPGTDIEVRQLFFNVPARRKFLRSEETERSHIQHYLTVAAFAFTETGFSLKQDGRVLWDLPAIQNRSATGGPLDALKERLKAFYGADLKLLPLDVSGDLRSLGMQPNPDDLNTRIRLWGFIGPPGLSRGTRQDQHLFVNRRPVENRGLNAALLEGYHTALMRGRYPVCCLFLEIDPSEVDVNIHPAKREVKFHHEHAVRRFVADSVRRILLGYHDSPVTQKAEGASSQYGARQPQQPVQPVELTPPSHAPQDLPALAAPVGRAQSQQAVPPPVRLLGTKAPASTLPLAAPTPPDLSSSSSSLLKTTHVASEPTPLLAVPLRLIGVVGRLYVLLESDRGLVLLDQHAAHERILFEQMLSRLDHGQAPSQRLLLPETIELSIRDAQFLREQLSTLTRLGIGLSEFGERTFMLDALPPFVKVPDSRRFVLDLVDELKAAGRDVNSWRLGEQTITKTVCRHAVKANDLLAGPELENLVQDLRHCAMPYTCPHGRPTLIEMSFRELEKKFGRTQ